MFRQKESGHAVTVNYSDEITILKESLKKMNDLWGLAGMSIQPDYMTGQFVGTGI